MAKKKTPLDAIRAKCKECSCGDKEEIINCPIKTCHLWPYRIELKLMENIDIELEQVDDFVQKEGKSKVGRNILDMDIPMDDD